MTPLRQRMLDDLRRRNYSPDTIRGYIRAVQQFAEYFGRSPEQMGAEELRRYQIHLLHERKLALGTVENCISALRFLYRKTLKRRDLAFDDLPFPKQPRTLPTVLSQDEVTRLIEAAPNLMDRTLPAANRNGSNGKQQLDAATRLPSAARLATTVLLD